MTLILLTSFTIFVLSILIYAWYNFKYLPQQYTKRLLSEGAVVVNFPKNPDDILYGIKKEIQTNPEMKAFVNKYPGSVSLFFTDAKLIKEVLSNHSYYSKLNKDSALNRIFNSKGVTVAEGEHWKLHRKILSEAFQYDLFNDMIPTIVELAEEVIRVSSKSKKTIYAPRDIELITCEAVTRLFFGLKSSDVVINGLKASEEVNVILRKRQVYNDSSIRFALGMWALNLYSDYRDIKRRMQTFRDVFSKKIYERMEEIKSNSVDTSNSNSNATSTSTSTKQRRDFLEILLQHRLKHNDDPSQTLSDEEILDEFSVFFLAGKDTTSLLVSMALYCFIKFPEWNERILAEMNDKIKDPYQINLDLLNSMDDLSAFLNEVLRMYPSAPGLLPRVANRDHYVGNIFVKKGYTVNALFIANHYNPKYFNNPEKFDPSRWIKAEAQARQEGWKNEAFAYLPFSAGARNCIGKHLALIEAKVILIMILKYHDVEIEEGFKFQLGNPGIGFGPQESIPFILTPKQL